MGDRYNGTNDYKKKTIHLVPRQELTEEELWLMVECAERPQKEMPRVIPGSGWVLL